MIKQFLKALGCIFFIAGGIIDDSFLGLPFAVGVAGFIPGVIITCLIWLLIVSIALLYLEAILSLPDGSNIGSLTRRYFGKTTQHIIVVFFLFIYSAPLLSSYIINLVPLFQSLALSHFALTLPEWSVSLLLFLFLACIIQSGLITTMIASFILSSALYFCNYQIIVDGSSFVTASHLQVGRYGFIFYAIPAIYSAWGFQAMIPSIVPFLERRRKFLVTVVLLGTLLPLLCMISMEWLVIGSVSEEDLWIAFDRARPIVDGYPLARSTSWYGPMLDYFNLLGQTTALLVNTYVLTDVIGDWAHFPLASRKGKKRFLLVLCSLAIPFFYSLFPDFIMSALTHTLNFGEIILASLIISIVWIMRYSLNSQNPRLLFGGKPMLFFLTLCFFYFLWIQGLSSLK